MLKKEKLVCTEAVEEDTMKFSEIEVFVYKEEDLEEDITFPKKEIQTKSKIEEDSKNRCRERDFDR